MPSFFRFILNSFIVVAGACLLGSLLSVLGWWMVSLFTSVGFGFAGMAVAASQLGENQRGTMFAIIASLIIVAGAAFMASFEIEHQPWPIKVSGLSVEEAPAHPWANLFYFRDGRVLTDLEGSADILGGSPKGVHAARVDVAYAVPVVPDPWTEGHPIAVWAVAKRSVYPERSRLWDTPARAGARVVGVNESDYLQAVDFSASVNHLTSVRNPVLIEWMPNPEGVVSQAWKLLGIIVGIGTCLMVALVGIVKILSGTGRPAAAKAPGP